MGEKTELQAFGSFSEQRLRAPAAPVQRAKITGEGSKTKAQEPPRRPSKTSRAGEKPAPRPADTRKPQTPAQRAASLRNLALARAARGN